MADDIDDLLDQVEDELCLGKSSKKQTQTRKNNAASSTEQPKAKAKCKTTGKCELDAMIDDIFEDSDHPLESSRVSSRKPSGSATSVSAIKGQRKCFPAYLGGSACVQGCATTVNQRVCDRLRCTDCDFTVSTFDNFKWHSSTDYLFLRLNMPDFERLKSKLSPKKGYRAYACQCKSRNVKDLTQLQAECDLKWVCGKH